MSEAEAQPSGTPPVLALKLHFTLTHPFLELSLSHPLFGKGDGPSLAQVSVTHHATNSLRIAGFRTHK